MFESIMKVVMGAKEMRKKVKMNGKHNVRAQAKLSIFKVCIIIKALSQIKKKKYIEAFIEAINLTV